MSFENADKIRENWVLSGMFLGSSGMFLGSFVYKQIRVKQNDTKCDVFSFPFYLYLCL